MSSILNNNNLQETSNSNWFKQDEEICRIKSSAKELDRRSNYLVKNRLGEGAFGYVDLLEPKEAGKCKAIKFSKGNYLPLKPEYEICLKWPKGATGLLLRPKAYLEDSVINCYIMHKYDTDMRKIISKMTPKEKIEAICQLSRGLVTLHGLGIAHRDIHVGNVFYDKNKNRYDLGDFGRAVTCTPSLKFFFDCLIMSDIIHLKINIETILTGELTNEISHLCNSYKPRSTLEDIMKLDFDSKSAELIIDFMNSTQKNAEEIEQQFAKIKSIIS